MENKADLINEISNLFSEFSLKACERNVDAARQLGFNFQPMVPERDLNQFRKEISKLFEDKV